MVPPSAPSANPTAIPPAANFGRALRAHAPTPRPTVPVGSPLELVLAGFTRREVTATASVSNNPVTVSPTLVVTDGVIIGSPGASDPTGAQLVYTVISAPSLGGKVTFNSGSTTGGFTYLPDLSVIMAYPTSVETFKILVAQKTPFDQFLSGIPIVGGAVPQVLVALHQTPIVGDLLAPIIGHSQVAEFDSTIVAGEDFPLNPVAFTYKVPSFDGTLISVNWFPASTLGPNGVPAGDLAPTVLSGPGLFTPSETTAYSEYSLSGPAPGVRPLREAGYNVVTWDTRGEYASGGILQMDNPFFEGRDVSSIISWVAAQPTSLLDSPTDPRLGMVGGSYGGAIQLVTAATDSRVDAIVPSIAWNSLNSALYPTASFKTAFASVLLLGLVQAGAQINSQIYRAVATGDLLGVLSPLSQSVLTSSGPTSLVNQIEAPALFIQGTVDGLFTLQQAIANVGQMRQAGKANVQMIWYCGGHGACLTPGTTGSRNLDASMDWLDYYVKDGNTVGSPPGLPVFQYSDQYGNWFVSDKLPSDPAFYSPPYQAVAGAPGGVLPIVPVLGGSGPAPQAALPLSLVMASEASNAINVAVPTQVGVQYVGAPVLSFEYSGIGTNRFVFAQLVDEHTGLVLGNLVTPVPVTMDGKSHIATIDLEDIVYSANISADTLKLQITSSATAYENFTAFGAINISNVGLALPTPVAVMPEP